MMLADRDVGFASFGERSTHTTEFGHAVETMNPLKRSQG
jgi:hypothetical protein